MCGIVGLVVKQKSGFTYAQQKMFHQMLWADMLRGSDATGVITVHKDKSFGIMKEASDSSVFNTQFIDSDLDKDLYKDGLAVIGHNRAKTVGANVDKNAHPFVIDETFAFVHNGTLRNHHSLTKTDVDSEALGIEFKQAMDKEDWKPAMEEKLGKVFGAYACVWYDQKRHTVNLIRNSERPLGILETDSAFIFASELPLAVWIAARNGDRIIAQKSLAIHEMYVFDMEKGGFSKENLLPSYPKSNYTYQGGYNNGTTVTPPPSNVGGAKWQAIPAAPTSLTTKPPVILDVNGKVIVPAHTLSDQQVITTTSTGVQEAKGTVLDDMDNDDFSGTDNPVGHPFVGDTSRLPSPVFENVDPGTGEIIQFVSKNGYKKLKGLMHRKIISFLCEDFVESGAGTCLVIGRSVDGAYDLCEVRHSIRGVFPTDSNMLSFDDLIPMIGTVQSMDYDKASGGVLIHVTDVKLQGQAHETIH